MNRTETTTLVLNGARGDAQAAEQLSVILYDELRRMAAVRLGGAARRHTLQPTALVNEAWLRLFDESAVGPREREHFLSLFAVKLRHVLVDHARKHGRIKHGGDRERVALVDVEAPPGANEVDLIALDEALVELAQVDPERARLVELHFFAGLPWDEAARTMGISPRTADLRWKATRAWLERRLSGT